jgi:hypothetical protein
MNHLHAIEGFIPGQAKALAIPKARDMHSARNGHENAARLCTSLPLRAEITKETSSLQRNLLFLPARIKNTTTIVFNPLLKTVSLDFPFPAFGNAPVRTCYYPFYLPYQNIF